MRFVEKNAWESTVYSFQRPLESNRNVPNNESVDDSFLDMTTYSALWGANVARRNKKPTIEELEEILKEK